MAANIVGGTGASNSAGRVYTVPLSGGAGLGYTTPGGADVTGLTLKATAAGITFSILSSPIVGTDIVITTDWVASSDLVVTLDISAASNLTDGLGNTAQGQTGVAITSGSTQPPFKHRASWIRIDQETLLVLFTPTDNDGRQGSTSAGWSVFVKYGGLGAWTLVPSTNSTFTWSGDNSNVFNLLLTTPIANIDSVKVEYDASVGSTRDNGNTVLQSFSSAVLGRSFPIDTAGVLVIGDIDYPTTGTIAPYRSNQTQFYLSVTGTGLEIVQEAFGTAWLKTIDGTDGTFTAASTPSGKSAPNTVFTGESDTTHTVIIIPGNSDAYLNRADFFIVYGAAPAIGANADAPVPINLYAPPNYVRVDGGYQPGTFGGVTRVASIAVMGEISFTVTLAVGRIRVFGPLGSGFQLSTDGGVTFTGNLTPTPPRTGDNILTIKDGLTTGTPLPCRIKGIAPDVYLSMLLLDPGDVIDTTAQPFRLTLITDGDSVWNGVGRSDLGHEFVTRTAAALGMAVGRMGGSGLNLTGDTNPFSGVLSGRIDIFVQGRGTNDAQRGLDRSTMQADYSTQITNVLPKLTVTGIMISPDITPCKPAWVDAATRTLYDTSKRAAVTAAADARVTSAVTDTALDPAQTDDVHPNDLGDDQLTSWFIGRLSTQPYTVTGPVAGVYTLTLNHGNVFNGLGKFTLTADTGTIDATVTGSTSGDGTGVVDVTPTAGQSAFTFAPSGPMTITPTNNWGWTDVAPITFDPSGGGSGVGMFAGMIGSGVF